MKKYIALFLFITSVYAGNLLANNTVRINIEQQSKKDIKSLFKEEQYYDIIKQYAVNDLKKMSEDELLYVGWSFYMLNESDKANRYVTNLLSRYNKNALAYHLQGLILVVEGNSEKALSSFLKAIEIDPTQGRFYTDAGNAYRDIEKLSEAVEYYKKGIDAKVPSEQAYFMLADIYDYQGDHKESLATFYDAKKHIRKDQELYATVLYNIGTIEMEDGNYSQAIVAYNELAEYFPDDYLTYSRLVQCCYALGDYEIGDTYKSVLYEAYEYGLLTDGEFAEKFCIDIFKVGDKVVSVYEFFHSLNETVKQEDTPIYVAYVVDKSGLIESEIQYTLLKGDKAGYMIGAFNPGDKRRTKVTLDEDLDYPKLKAIIKTGVQNNYLFSFGIK